MKNYKISHNNITREINNVTFQEAIDIAIGISNNISNCVAKVIQVNEDSETAEVNVYINDSFNTCETVLVKENYRERMCYASCKYH